LIYLYKEWHKGAWGVPQRAQKKKEKNKKKNKRRLGIYLEGSKKG
jgi:hypothetical protein